MASESVRIARRSRARLRHRAEVPFFIGALRVRIPRAPRLSPRPLRPSRAGRP
jgi:hypothetical protein